MSFSEHTSSKPLEIMKSVSLTHWPNELSPPAPPFPFRSRLRLVTPTSPRICLRVLLLSFVLSQGDRRRELLHGLTESLPFLYSDTTRLQFHWHHTNYNREFEKFNLFGP